MTTQPEPNDELKKVIERNHLRRQSFKQYAQTGTIPVFVEDFDMILSSASREQQTREIAVRLAKVIQMVDECGYGHISNVCSCVCGFALKREKELAKKAGLL